MTFIHYPTALGIFLFWCLWQIFLCDWVAIPIRKAYKEATEKEDTKTVKRIDLLANVITAVTLLMSIYVVACVVVFTFERPDLVFSHGVGTVIFALLISWKFFFEGMWNSYIRAEDERCKRELDFAAIWSLQEKKKRVPKVLGFLVLWLMGCVVYYVI